MLVNPMTMYSSNLGEAVRQKVEEENIIEKNKLILELKDLKNILKYFRSNLIKDELDHYRISRINEERYDFIISYAIDELSTKREKIDKIQILKGLGQMFLMKETITNEKRKIESTKLGINAMYAGTFARAILMPKNLFVNNVIKNSLNDEIDMYKVSDIFDVDYIDVVARGRELQLYR